MNRLKGMPIRLARTVSHRRQPTTLPPGHRQITTHTRAEQALGERLPLTSGCVPTRDLVTVFRRDRQALYLPAKNHRRELLT
jgi:hypothetical protein